MKLIAKCPITPIQSAEIKRIVCQVIKEYCTSLNIKSFKGVKILPDKDFPSNVMASMDNGWIILRENTKQNTNNQSYLLNLYSDIYHEFCHMDLQYNYPVLHQTKDSTSDGILRSAIYIWGEYMAHLRSMYLEPLSKLNGLFIDCNSINWNFKNDDYETKFLIYSPYILARSEDDRIKKSGGLNIIKDITLREKLIVLSNILQQISKPNMPDNLSTVEPIKNYLLSESKRYIFLTQL